MMQSEKLDALGKAIAAAQAEIPAIHKKGRNPHFRSTYARLEDILEGIKPVLAKHGLSVLQFPVSDGEMVGIKTMLLHSSGQFISSQILIKPVKAGSQEVGSISTYFQRYGLGAVLGIPTEEDDDGNSSSPEPKKQAPPTQSQAAPKAFQEMPMTKKEDNVDKKNSSAKLANVKSLAKKLGWSSADVSSHLKENHVDKPLADLDPMEIVKLEISLAKELEAKNKQQPEVEIPF